MPPPRRLRLDDPNASGLLCGHHPSHLSPARRWATQALRSTPCASRPLVAALAELHANALAHTASGLPGGRVRIEIERCPALFLLKVTDDGPRPGTQAPALPEVIHHPETATGGGFAAEGGYGLALVESMALYWDFVGDPGEALTVRAAFARSGHIRDHNR
ncbi:ATP-binding protein [Nocardiopsis lambiniae]|uniref:ATP-binding protein n=1 Tax=Nocardiopsis lambiniae TaxID=3075539 RepID=A0ABU2MFK1_9ACTN|nr:ATP-binding protein [Nocardiopsis sp. DSM 44743]MDT0331478.1 ATP-binding protein [Nocardiopsis sp. DSM 44743]